MSGATDSWTADSSSTSAGPTWHSGPSRDCGVMKSVIDQTRLLLAQASAAETRAFAMSVRAGTAARDRRYEDFASAAGADGMEMRAAARYLLGRCDGRDDSWRIQRVDLVWTGPLTASVPARATAVVLVDVIAAAKDELVLMTYSAKHHQQTASALHLAIDRVVRVDVVVETLPGAGGAISGPEPAAAFSSLPTIRIYSPAGSYDACTQLFDPDSHVADLVPLDHQMEAGSSIGRARSFGGEALRRETDQAAGKPR